MRSSIIVVCKNELYINLLKKQVERGRNGISVVAWDEKTWLSQKKTGKINNNVLFIGEIKGVDNIIPLLDIKYDQYGVRYGWAGKQAVIYIDPKEVRKKENYEAFLEELQSIDAPLAIKEYRKKVGVKSWMINFIPGVGTGIHIGNLINDPKMLKQQMTAYGIVHFATNEIRNFLNEEVDSNE